MNDASNLMEIIAGTLFIVLTIMGAWKLFTSQMKKLVSMPLSVEHAKIHKEITDDLNNIKDNFLNNNGHSMRDAIDRIESKVNTIQGASNFMFDQQGLGYIETEADGYLTYCNKTHLQTLDMELSELEGNGWVNAIHPKDKDRLYKEWTDAIEQKRDLINEFTTHNGVKIKAHSHPIKDSDGNITKWISLLQKK